MGRAAPDKKELARYACAGTIILEIAFIQQAKTGISMGVAISLSLAMNWVPYGSG